MSKREKATSFIIGGMPFPRIVNSKFVRGVHRLARDMFVVWFWVFVASGLLALALWACGVK